jgi:hypothetical protein
MTFNGLTCPVSSQRGVGGGKEIEEIGGGGVERGGEGGEEGGGESPYQSHPLPHFNFSTLQLTYIPKKMPIMRERDLHFT